MATTSIRALPPVRWNAGLGRVHGELQPQRQGVLRAQVDVDDGIAGDGRQNLSVGFAGGGQMLRSDEQTAKFFLLNGEAFLDSASRCSADWRS